ncbi:hypothetical protein J2045_003317 [Peteryoungia aggregata LMG 23059]|uniref:Phage tail protein n=1 Tax=Peteryoungia aggregata LMG 23059 TaxID=1368425 RepID=A0ABU0GA79_9HYPH|nr:hypothetical protein [Peteryoungia aggregata]MDQ0422269.1 hypothetical protein [Peteryoungia aggregata LMG 23059]
MATVKQTIPGAGWTRLSQNKTLLLEIDGGGAVFAHIAETAATALTLTDATPGHFLDMSTPLSLGAAGYDVYVRAAHGVPVNLIYTAI